MTHQSCLRLLRKISGFTNCPHPYRDDGKGGCVKKVSGDLGCEPPQFQCGDDCCEIPLGCDKGWPWVDCGPGCCEIPIQLILIIIVIILTPPFLRSTVKKPADSLESPARPPIPWKKKRSA